MAKFETELTKDDWNTIDPETLSAEQRNAWLESRDAYRKAKDARERFEAIVRADDAPGLRTVFGYRFGKLSFATVEAGDVPAKAKPKGKSLSLADYRAMQAERNH